jgi:hypothetical protein
MARESVGQSCGWLSARQTDMYVRHAARCASSGVPRPRTRRFGAPRDCQGGGLSRRLSCRRRYGRTSLVTWREEDSRMPLRLENNTFKRLPSMRLHQVSRVRVPWGIRLHRVQHFTLPGKHE